MSKCTAIINLPVVDESIQPSLNTCLVLGTTINGQGHFSHQRLKSSSINVRPINKNLYYKLEKGINVQVTKVVGKVLDEAIKEKKIGNSSKAWIYISGAWFTRCGIWTTVPFDSRNSTGTSTSNTCLTTEGERISFDGG